MSAAVNSVAVEDPKQTYAQSLEFAMGLEDALGINPMDSFESYNQEVEQT